MKKISVIIVNYNVKDFLEQALESVKRSLKGIESEIIVVDNNSIDGSLEMLKKRFPDVDLIASKENLGFSGGNNLALKKASGGFIVLLNPDTLVQENTFSILLEFFKKTPDASAATCKILNPDGSFSIDCRHSIPTPLTALWKTLGLNRLFPKSRIFGKYNLTYLNENETYPVEAISGSFMMLKKEVVKKIGLLDESFFMYCEDIDYCYRINQSGGKIYYVPDTQIIHYKGESTKKNNLDYIKTFNKSLFQFYKKHYHNKYIYPFRWLILMGIIFRGVTIFLGNFIRNYIVFLIDLLVLNLAIFFGFFVRLEYERGFHLQVFFNELIIINLLTSVVFYLTSLFFNNIGHNKTSIGNIIKVNISTYTLVSALTFFLKQFAFSRVVVMLAAFFSITTMLFWRVGLRYIWRQSTNTLGKQFFQKKTLIAGIDKETSQLIKKINNKVDSGIKIIGLIAPSPQQVGKTIEGIPVLASIDRIAEYFSFKKINMVIFSTKSLSYEQILNTMTDARRLNIEFKMVPSHLGVMIGKAEINQLDSVPLLDIEYAYGKLFNLFIKRSFDIFLSFFVFCFASPLSVLLIVKHHKIKYKYINQDSKNPLKILWVDEPAYLKFIILIVNIFLGKLSFVGSPIEKVKAGHTHYKHKPGLTGIVQINKKDSNMEELELYYLKNHSFTLDVQILFLSIINIFKRNK